MLKKIGLVFLLIVSLSGLAFAQSYYRISKADMDYQIDRNPGVAKEMFNHQYLEISGIVSIATDLDAIFIENPNKFVDFNSITCRVKTAEQKAIVRRLVKGQPIVVRGYITDVSSIFGYYMDIIEIVEY